jgi:hypothetical protein
VTQDRTTRKYNEKDQLREPKEKAGRKDHEKKYRQKE